MDKRELVKKVMDGKSGDRVPVGFWYHFTDISEFAHGHHDNDTMDRVIAGTKKMIEEFKPDMIKIMSDGFFIHPSIVDNDVTTIEGLSKIKHIDRDHPWITKQVDLINKIIEMSEGQICIYNIFSAVQQLRLYIELILEDVDAYETIMINHTEEAMKAFKIVEEDTNMLLDEIKKNTDVDGIYYSVQMLQHDDADEEFHQKWIVPSDLITLEHINELWEYNMLHICGYERYHNNIEFFKQYPCKSYNWATHTDDVTMKEGKEIFNSCVCGGFDNNSGTLIDTGSIEEIKKFTKEIIEDAGREGLILGADCTVPMDIDFERLNAIRDAGR